MSLVSSQGASTSSFLPYCATLGRREQAFRELQFPGFHIYRPGALDRGATDRWKEKILYTFLPNSMFTKVGDLAKLMVSRAGWKGETTLEGGEIRDRIKEMGGK
jgi:hypothetical protein